MGAQTSTVRRIKLKSIALPAEHGGWGFLMEPLVLGILVAPGLAGVSIILATVSAFLIRTPSKIAAVDRRRGKRYTRTIIAERFVLLYGGLAMLGLLSALHLTGLHILIPALIAAPLAGIQLLYDMRSDSRHWLPELAGSTAMGASAAIIMLAGGWPLTAALGGWALIAARNIPSILYVRSRLRMAKAQPYSRVPATAAHLMALVGLGVLATSGLTPWLTILAGGGLLLRALNGLTPQQKDVKASTIGFQEIAFGLAYVLLAAIGYAAGL
jgi:hypothetical protein